MPSSLLLTLGGANHQGFASVLTLFSALPDQQMFVTGIRHNFDTSGLAGMRRNRRVGNPIRPEHLQDPGGPG